MVGVVGGCRVRTELPTFSAALSEDCNGNDTNYQDPSDYEPCHRPHHLWTEFEPTVDTTCPNTELFGHVFP